MQHTLYQTLLEQLLNNGQCHCMGVCAPHTTPGCTAGTFLIIIWVGHQGSELVLIACVDTVKTTATLYR